MSPGDFVTQIEAAKADWLAISVPSARSVGVGGKGIPLDGAFRELDGIAIWLSWEAGAAWIKKFERTTREPSGKAAAALRRLQEISDRYGVPLWGNVAPIKTAECPDAEQVWLEDFYRRAGFSVGGPPAYFLSYPPRT